MNNQIDYYKKIAGALQEIFNEESEFFIDITDKNFNTNHFFHVLSTRVPQGVFIKLTNNNLDPLEFNHVCNKLIMQDMVEKHKK